MLEKLGTFLKKPYKGATAIEYVLIVSLIAIVLMASAKRVGKSYDKIYTDIINGFETA